MSEWVGECVSPCPAGLFTAYLVIDERSCQRHATLRCHYGRNTTGTDAEETPHHMPYAVEPRKVRHFMPTVVQRHLEQRCGYHAQQSDQIVGGQAAERVKKVVVSISGFTCIFLARLI